MNPNFEKSLPFLQRPARVIAGGALFSVAVLNSQRWIVVEQNDFSYYTYKQFYNLFHMLGNGTIFHLWLAKCTACQPAFWQQVINLPGKTKSMTHAGAAFLKIVTILTEKTTIYCMQLPNLA